jgi:hypothetical protein
MLSSLSVKLRRICSILSVSFASYFILLIYIYLDSVGRWLAGFRSKIFTLRASCRKRIYIHLFGFHQELFLGPELMSPLPRVRPLSGATNRM